MADLAVILRTYPAHEEAGERRFAVAVSGSSATRRNDVRAIELQPVGVAKDPATGRREVVPTTDEVEAFPADLVLLAIGFEGVEHMPLLDGLGFSLTKRGTLSCGSDWESAPGVFVCGDAHRALRSVVGRRRRPLGGQRGGRLPHRRLDLPLPCTHRASAGRGLT